MKKMRGVVDPISLGFLIAAMGAGLGIASNVTSTDKDQLMQQPQAQVEQVITKKEAARVNFDMSMLDTCNMQ